MSSLYEDDFTQSARTASNSRRSNTAFSRQRYQNTNTKISQNYQNDTIISHNQETRNTNGENGLSSKQLKTKLIESVRNKGILNSMKSHLRNKLALELNTNIEQMKNKTSLVTTSNQKARSNLALNTINCLLIDHLKSNEYDYTLSVFMPECGINLNEVYGLSDILQILKVSNESKLYNDLINSSVIKSKGLLWYLVNYFCSHYVTNEISTQTEYDGVHNIAASLDLKMKNLDNYYAKKTDNLNEKLSFEEKISLYQKKVEEKIRSEYAEKVHQFKDIELAKIRFEEREKIRVENQAFRMDLDHTYQKRNDNLKQREETVDECLKQRKELEERELFSQRQHLIEELKQLRAKEAAFKQTTDNAMYLTKTDTSKFEKSNEELRLRENQLKQREEDFAKRLNSERERIKMDLERAYGHREFILQSVENKNKQDAQYNEIERTQLERIKHEHHTQSLHIGELELASQKSSGEAMCLKQENELIKDKLNRCMDYDFIKQENKMLKYKLEVSKEMIGEKSVGMKSGRKSASLMTPRDQMNSQMSYVPQRKRSVTFASEIGEGGVNIPKLPVINDDEASEMGADLTVFTDNNGGEMSYRDEGDRLLSEVIEVKEIEEDLQNHTLVNNELRDLYEMQVFEQRKLHETINDVKKHVEFLYNGVMLNENGQTVGSEKSLSYNKEILDTSLDFIESAKDRLKYLENEGQNIEQGYRDYQYKVKSKYYPINDDTENEIKIISEKKMKIQKIDNLDIEKFLESTLKANMNAKIMRDDLEKEIADHKCIKNEKQKSYHERELQNVQDLIQSVPILNKDRSVYNSEIANQSVRNQLLSDKNVMENLKSNFNNLLNKDDKSERSRGRYTLEKTTQLYEDDSSTATLENTKKKGLKKSSQNVKIEVLDDDKTLDSEYSKISTTIASKKQNSLNNGQFGLGDYVKMFNDSGKKEKKKSNLDSDRTETPSPPKKSTVGRVKIEYSSSSSSSLSQSDSNSDSEKKLASFNKQSKRGNNNDETDDDFKW